MSIINTVLGSVLPGTPADKIEEAKVAIQAQLANNEILKAQINVDNTEAASSSLFVSGWRPMVGWVCALAFAWQFLGLPIILLTSTITGHPIPVPTFDISSMTTVLMGMLGLGGMRTYEKINNVQNRH